MKSNMNLDQSQIDRCRLGRMVGSKGVGVGGC